MTGSAPTQWSLLREGAALADNMGAHESLLVLLAFLQDSRSVLGWVVYKIWFESF